MFKKITALALLAVLLCLSLLGCGAPSADVPKGMQAAYLEGEPFRLYLPEGWSINDASGISGGFYYTTERVIANARYHVPENPDMTADDYLLACAEGYAKSLTDFVIVSREAALLGGENAKMLVYTATLHNVPYTCTQYTAKHDGLLISLYLYVPTQSAELMAEVFGKIRESFAFAERQTTPREPLVDDTTPAGMQIASGKDAAHRLYVPTSWVCHPDSGRSTAYVDESGRPNVSVTLYEPAETMTPEGYISLCKERYAASLSGYELLSEESCQIAGRTGKVFTYRAAYDGINFRFRQTVFSDGRVIYSLTYTALDDRFEAHLKEVTAIESAFTFR